MDIRELLLVIPVLLFSVIVHEVAHGWVALREGDPTAFNLGRLTLNPLPHIDPFGSILVPLMLWMSPAKFLFGWAKPVPVNPRNFRDYRRGDILVSLAGIGANLLLAVAFTAIAALIGLAAQAAPALIPTLAVLQRMAAYGVWINLVLAFFNLIPIPPLDGSHVLYHLLPPRLGMRYRELGRYGMLVLLAVMFLLPGVIQVLMWPALFLRSQAFSLIPSLS
jgi:Zn-dependent protease